MRDRIDMEYSTSPGRAPLRGSWLRSLVAAAITLLLIAAHAARLGVFAVLAALEPIIRILLSLLAMGGLAACVLYRFVVHAPHFPFGLMLMLSAGFSVLLVLYYLAMRALSP